MARLVRHDATGPIRIDPQEKPVFICACGLSKNQPYCDGSHKLCHDEQPAKMYIYDADSSRHESSDPFADGDGEGNSAR